MIFDASRLTRDWHHLLKLCGLVEARAIDFEGIYDPCRPNDRLLLGMKSVLCMREIDGSRCVRVVRPDILHVRLSNITKT